MASSPAAAGLGLGLGHGEGAMMMSAGGAVCCMCGDHGLADELFRCRCCRARLQHRYCSDLYPKAAAYRRCNWCLREPGVGGAGHATAAAANNKHEDKRKTTASESDEERQRQEVSSYPSPRRTSPPAELGHPVKKKYRAEEKAPQPAAAADNRPEDKRKTAALASDEERLQLREGCSPRRRSRSPTAKLGHHPVKKKHMAELKTPEPAAAAGKKEIVIRTGAGGGSKDEEVMRAGTKARVNRVRVRRYKLLTEVISC